MRPQMQRTCSPTQPHTHARTHARTLCLQIQRPGTQEFVGGSTESHCGRSVQGSRYVLRSQLQDVRPAAPGQRPLHAKGMRVHGTGGVEVYHRRAWSLMCRQHKLGSVGMRVAFCAVMFWMRCGTHVTPGLAHIAISRLAARAIEAIFREPDCFFVVGNQQKNKKSNTNYGN
jgi:hypothetical protein